MQPHVPRSVRKRPVARKRALCHTDFDFQHVARTTHLNVRRTVFTVLIGDRFSVVLVNGRLCCVICRRIDIERHLRPILFVHVFHVFRQRNERAFAHENRRGFNIVRYFRRLRTAVTRTRPNVDPGSFGEEHLPRIAPRPFENRRNKNIISQKIFVVILCLYILRILDIEAAHDRQARFVIFVRKRVIERQQAVTHILIGMGDLFRRRAIIPRHSSSLLRLVPAVHAKNRRECTELKPAGIFRIGGIHVVSADIRRNIGQPQFRTRIDRAFDFLSEPVALRTDIARPLNGIAVRRQIGGVGIRAIIAAVHVRHNKRTFCISVQIGNAFEIFSRDPLISVHARGVTRIIGCNLIERNRPVAVVPPIVHTHSKQHRQFFVAVCDFVLIEQIARALYGFRVVVKANVYAELVRFVQKTLHIGEKLCVDIVSDSAPSRLRPPVGVDHKHVNRKALILIIFDLLQSRLLVVLIVTRIPLSEGFQLDHFGLSRQFDEILHERFIISVRQKCEDIGCIAIKIPTLQRSTALGDGISVVGGNHARAVGKIPARELVGGRRQIDVGIRQSAVYIDCFPRFIGDKRLARSAACR